jgi:hypothetical protein
MLPKIAPLQVRIECKQIMRNPHREPKVGWHGPVVPVVQSIGRQHAKKAKTYLRSCARFPLSPSVFANVLAKISKRQVG